MFSLRSLQYDDLRIVLEWRNRPDIREKMFTTHEISEAEHYAYFERIKNDHSKRYFMCVDEAGNPVGVVNFIDIDPKNRHAFWGFYSGNPTRRGVGTQMGYLALTHGFDVLNLHKLNAEVLSTNPASLNFHQKLGFQFEGTFKEHHLTPDGYVDIHRIAIFKRDWMSEWKEKSEERLRSANSCD